MHISESSNGINQLAGLIRKLVLLVVMLTLTLVIMLSIFVRTPQAESASGTDSLNNSVADTAISANADNWWQPADVSAINDPEQKKMAEYGRELIVHTAAYFGPKGSLSQNTNGLNCQNCHLQAGTAVFGNNYGAAAANYPKFRDRSGSVESLAKRVNDCFERSLNGTALDTNSSEMRAILAYITYIGSNVPKGSKVKGAGLKELAFLDRAADPAKGKLVYESKCQSCHQPGGAGQWNEQGTEFAFPALWGANSYNDGAGLFRLSNFARFVKYNMPLGATHENPVLTDEEAWDVAAFVNSQDRPHKNTSADWPDISKKPVDHPFGPYKDQFSEIQHKFGPFQPIKSGQAK